MNAEAIKTNDMNSIYLFYCKRNKYALEKKECIRRQERRATYSPGDPSPSYLECRDCKQGRKTKEAPQEEKQMGEKTSASIPVTQKDQDKKQCSRCKEFKPLDTFGPNKAARDGKNSYCKKCNAKRSKEYWDKKHRNTKPEKEPGTPKRKPAEKHPDLDSLIVKLETHKAILVAELDRINTTLSMIQERM